MSLPVLGRLKGWAIVLHFVDYRRLHCPKLPSARCPDTINAVVSRPNYSLSSSNRDRSYSTSTTSDASTPIKSTSPLPITGPANPGLCIIPCSAPASPPSLCDQERLKAPIVDLIVALGFVALSWALCAATLF